MLAAFSNPCHMQTLKGFKRKAQKPLPDVHSQVSPWDSPTRQKINLEDPQTTARKAHLHIIYCSNGPGVLLERTAGKKREDLALGHWMLARCSWKTVRFLGSGRPREHFRMRSHFKTHNPPGHRSPNITQSFCWADQWVEFLKIADRLRSAEALNLALRSDGLSQVLC